MVGTYILILPYKKQSRKYHADNRARILRKQGVTVLSILPSIKFYLPTSIILALVFGPTRPSETKPLSACHFLITAMVFGPKMPSNLSPRLSVSFKNLCSSFTASPLEPFLKVIVPRLYEEVACPTVAGEVGVPTETSGEGVRVACPAEITSDGQGKPVVGLKR